MDRRWVPVGLVACAAALLAACGGTATGSPKPVTGRPTTTTTTSADPGQRPLVVPPRTTTTYVPPTPVCRNDQIRWSTAPGGLAGGDVGEILVFTNGGTATCTLSGYPVVAALDAQGSQATLAIDSPSGPLGGLPFGTAVPPIVVVAPGSTASAVIEAVAHGAGASTTCPTYYSFRVTPPDLSRSLRVPAHPLDPSLAGFPGCGPISVHPVVPGTRGRVA